MKPTIAVFALDANLTAKKRIWEDFQFFFSPLLPDAQKRG